MKYVPFTINASETEPLMVMQQCQMSHMMGIYPYLGALKIDQSQDLGS